MTSQVETEKYNWLRLRDGREGVYSRNVRYSEYLVRLFELFRLPALRVEECKLRGRSVAVHWLPAPRLAGCNALPEEIEYYCVLAMLTGSGNITRRQFIACATRAYACGFTYARQGTSRIDDDILSEITRETDDIIEDLLKRIGVNTSGCNTRDLLVEVITRELGTDYLDDLKARRLESV